MSVSFIHHGDATMASYRYRSAIPAKQLGWSINDYDAGTLVFSKPSEPDYQVAVDSKAMGKNIVVDFCDNHFTRYRHYRDMLTVADAIICPTKVMAEIIGSLGYAANVVIDPYLYSETAPHCGANLLVKPDILWFGHSVNLHSLKRVYPTIDDYDITVVTNAPGFTQWSEDEVLKQLSRCDIVILPATDMYKSANRAIEAIRRGCMVVAEPHPSLNGLPVYVGDIREGIEWTRKHRSEANEMIRVAQGIVRERYSPKIQASALKNVMAQFSLMLDAERLNGTGGLELTSPMQMSAAT